jgi:hypothetical protein
MLPFNHSITEFTKEEEITHGKGFYYKGQRLVHHSDLPHSQSAFKRFSTAQIITILTGLLLFIISLLINWHAATVFILAVLTSIYFIDLLFNLFLVYRSYSLLPEINIPQEKLDELNESELPIYTIFCPLYKEPKVVPQFAKAMSQIDYPKSKLQVLLILEEDDTYTVNEIKKLKLKSYINYIIVPHSIPKTKPKACNYALQFAKGEYLVIYDAEDIPDPLQLKKAFIAFKEADPKVICIQAKLNFYNPHQNLLTRVFTAEYSLWFDLVLTGLQSIHAPIPLGGTSNHFRAQDLHRLKGWDSFNVTEDADLGMRLSKNGYRTAVIQSITLEEANSEFKNWFWQRTRWIKGYIQTYFLHVRDPRQFINTWTKPHFLIFQLVIGGKITSMFINPIMWIITISYFTFRQHIGLFIETFFPTPVLYMGVLSLLLGNFLYIYYYMIGSVKHGHDDLVKYFWLIPFYWIAMSAAAWVALTQFIINPYHWSKTRHGLHLNTKTPFTYNPIKQEQITLDPIPAYTE